MINKKEILWSVLSKYDSDKSLKSFCDSVSKFIQDKQDFKDIIRVFQGLSIIDKSDKNKINQVIGGDIDLYLFSI